MKRRTRAAPAAGPVAPGIQNWFTPGRFAAMLALFIGVTFLNVFLGQRTFYYRDFGLFTYPVAHYYRECFWRGELPLWNPLNYCGIPLLAQWNTAVLYPPSLFYLLFPLSWSLGVFNLGHLFLAGLGMYFLARRWTGNPWAAALAGVAFAFNGLSWHMLMWISNLAAWAWMPWVVLAVETAWRRGGRSLALAALAGALQMLTGAPEIIVFTWLLLGVLWLWQWVRREAPRKLMLGRALGVGLLVAGLSAPQLLPFLDLLRSSTRDPTFSDSGWSMPLAGPANFLVPLFRARDGGGGVFVQLDQYWTPSVYIGVGIVALALVGMWRARGARAWILVGATAVGLLAALGGHGFLYPALKSLFPALGFMRYPIKFIALTLFGLPLLAACGVNWYQASPRNSTQAERSLAAVSLVLAGLIAVILGQAGLHAQAGEDWPMTLRNGLGRTGFFALMIGVLVLLRRTDEVRKQRLWALALLLLTWMDVFTHMPEVNPTAGRDIYQTGVIRDNLKLAAPRFGEPRFMPTLAAIEKVRFNDSDAVAHYLACQLSIYDDCNLLESLPSTDGFYSVELREPSRLLSVLATSEAKGADVKGMLDFLGVGFISAVVPPPNNGLVWVERRSALPLVTAGQQPVFADGTNAGAAILSADFDPRRVVYLPTVARPFITAANPVAARVLPRSLGAQKLDFDVETPAVTMVTVAQAFYHPWHAYVDGREAQLWYANYAFQALEVPAGHHQVSLIYEDQSFSRGLLIGVGCLLLCVALWFRKSSPDPAECAEITRNA